MKAFSFIVILGFFLAFTTCDDKEIIPKPKNLLSEETYINLLLELQILDSWVFTSTDSTFSDSLTNELFDFYNIDKDLFISSHTYYQSQLNGQIGRIDSALNILKTEQNLHNPNYDD